MKIKTLNNKINSYINLAGSFHRKYEITMAGQNIENLNVLEADLEAAVTLQKEVLALKDALKTKKKELEIGVEKLKKDKSEFKKAVKSIRKASKFAGTDVKEKESIQSKKKSSAGRKKKSRK